MTNDEIQEARDLARRGMSLRAIARKLGRDRKTLRKVLDLAPPKPSASKLESFQEIVREKFSQGLFAPRILREIRERGYTGSLTLLKSFLRTLGPRKKQPRKAFRRFETKVGIEAQVDWSPYRIKIAGVETVAHCFSMILCFSRRMWIGFFRNERLPTLLYAHVEAFTYHGGVCQRLVYDNMTQVSLGRVGGRPLWHPVFLPFAKHYGFDPFAHKVGHKERSGKVERPFFYIETDFLKGKTFESWEDLNRQGLHWLDTVANVREHSTTKRHVHEAYAEEKPFLIRLPSLPFGAERREVRKVQKDGYVPVDGSFYPVPARLVGQHVSVRIYPVRVEILDASGRIAAAHPIPDRPLRIPQAADAPAARGESVSRTELETRFLARFPGFADFLDGLRRRMNALTPIHLKKIEALVAIYGEAAVQNALERAREYRNWSAPALGRILETAHPNVVPEPPLDPLTARPEVLGVLDDVDSGSPQDYTLDSVPPTPTPEENHGPKE